MWYETKSFMKKYAAEVDFDEPMAVARNAVPARILESHADSSHGDEAVALVKLLATSSREYAQGKHCSTDALKRRLFRRFMQS